MEKKQKKMELTNKHKEILSYVFNNGGEDVSLAASEVGQNKNFYMRVQKIEREGLVKVHRIQGEASRFTLTDKGIAVTRALMKHPKESSISLSEQLALLDSVQRSNLDCEKKELIIGMLTK